MQIICLEEKSVKITDDGDTKIRINDVGLFANIALARYSIQWKMACYKYMGDTNVNRKYQSLSKIDTDSGESRTASLVEKTVIGDHINRFIKENVGIIYMLEIVNNIDEYEFIQYDRYNAYKDLSDISRIYYTDIEAILSSEIWQYFIHRSRKYKYDFKSHYANHYIDIVNKRSVNIKPMVIRVKRNKR